MKDSIKSTPYFSAYSLKAFESASAVEPKSRNKQFLRVINRLRILPIGTSYTKTTSINKINIPATIQPADKNWYINYE
jgi:hypothetical protein